MTRMTHQINMKSARGRPKGTGIDDWTRLQQVAALIAANPELKPTTAIKTIGVTDPSAIRRLRDKFHQAQDELMTTIRRARAPAKPRQKSQVVSAAAASTNAPSAAPEPAKSPQVDPAPSTVPAATCASAVAAPIRTNPPPFGPFVALMGFGLQAATAAVEQQFSLCRQALRSPVIETLIRQQLIITELMIAAATPRRSAFMPRH
jgi:hypothetical protein